MQRRPIRTIIVKIMMVVMILRVRKSGMIRGDLSRECDCVTRGGVPHLLMHLAGPGVFAPNSEKPVVAVNHLIHYNLCGDY